MSAHTGLSEAEAARRLEARGPVEPPATSRSTGSIVRANVFTVFNVILLVLGGVTLAFGDWRDALFLGIVVSNAAIGITQEVRAKLALDRLAALVEPYARTIRNGSERQLHVSEIVVGDLVRLQAGDQVVADGPLVSATALALDESILSGESRPVVRGVGEEARSGSFAVEGEGLYEVAAVGADSYAERVAGEAREFRHPRSPLERALNRLLFVLVGVMVPLGAVLVFALWKRDEPVDDAVATAVAGMVTLVPEGLILLASLTYAAAALALARRGALAQQLNAIESLASVDTLCLDKTGTLTDARLRVLSLVPAGGTSPDELAEALGRYAASAPSRNLTLEALAEAYPQLAEEPAEVVPFASRTRWSALRLGDTGYVLGAPELFPLGPLAGEARTEQLAGRRVLALGTTTAAFDRGTDGIPPPSVPLGLAVLAEELRPEARETVEFFLAQGVELKVLSGDSPETVASIAADAGIRLAGPPLDGRELPDDPDELRRVALAASVIGRISPEGKRRVIEALTGAGRYVAMVGDGVNDVPALKAARLAIAQGTGAQMTKSVADVVLVDGDFGSVPRMVAEGRKILRNIQRVTKLFVTKSALAVFLILSIGVTPQEYPLLPRHLTLAASIAIGIPAFFLALAPSEGPWRSERFLRDVARFAVPAGVAAGLGVLAAYLLVLNVFALGLVEARTVATTVLILVGLWLIVVLEASGRRRSTGVGVLCGVLLASYGVVLSISGLRDFFQLAVPGTAAVAMALFGAGLAVAFLWLTDDRFVPGRAAKLE